jgi:F0F1-type ATP synthase assembly protein I
MGPRDDDREPARSFGRGYVYVGVGFQFAGSILFFLFLGWKADAWIGTRPLLTILGAFLGGALGFYAMMRQVRKDTERFKAERGER